MSTTETTMASLRWLWEHTPMNRANTAAFETVRDALLAPLDPMSPAMVDTLLAMVAETGDTFDPDRTAFARALREHRAPDRPVTRRDRKAMRALLRAVKALRRLRRQAPPDPRTQAAYEHVRDALAAPRPVA